MDFSLNEEQRMLQEMVRDFAKNEVAPFVPRMENGEFPRPLLKKMGELGLMGVPIPEEYGGAGMDFVSYILTIHELSKVSPTLAVILSVHTSVGTNPILYFGTEEQKQKYIRKLAGGEYLAAFCLTEANSGSDAKSLQTKAIRDGDHYIINGSKMFITNGGEADVNIVFAKTAPEKISTFIVEKETPGFIFGKDEKKMGLAGSRTVQLNFENMRIPASQLLGQEGNGYKVAMANLNAGRIGIAAQALGIAEGAFEHARQYAKERIQFGKPLIKNQAVAFKLADMATQIEASRLLVYQSAFLHNGGKDCRKQVSMAKLLASQTAVDVSIEAIQIFGGYGYTKKYPVERFFRDAKVTEIYEGTSEIQRMVISNQL